MEANVVLTGIGNYVSLQDGKTENRLFFRLPSGKQVSSTISDEDLQVVVEEFGGSPTAKPVPTTDKVAQHAMMESSTSNGSSAFEKEILGSGEEALVFNSPPTPPVSVPLVEDLPPIAPPPRARLVGQDSAGNPILEVDGAVHMDSVTGTAGNRDEDGVAQI